MAYTQEPDIVQGSEPEETLRKSIIEEIEKILEQKKLSQPLIEYFLLQNFGLDVAVFVTWINRSTVRFLELKAFVAQRQGGVGFGNQQGKGSQVDLLLLGKSQLNLADQFIRWIVVDGTKPKGSTRFAILNNNQAQNAAMGGVRREKQNNFRLNTLMSNAITWNELSKALEAFLTT